MSPHLPDVPERDNSGSDCEIDEAAADTLPNHIQPCTCDTHDGVCEVCNFKISLGTAGVEYGHARVSNRSPRLGEEREDCPHRPAECDPGGPRGKADHQGGEA